MPPARPHAATRLPPASPTAEQEPRTNQEPDLRTKEQFAAYITHESMPHAASPLTASRHCASDLTFRQHFET